MSYTALETVSWGSAPVIGASFSYDYQRSDTNMLYRVKISISPLGGSSYFGYPIYADLTLDGSTLIAGASVKAAGPSTWSSAIVYESGWMSLYKTSGTTLLGITLYSGSGSTRSQAYSYTLPVSSYGSSGSAAVSMSDFSLIFGDFTIGQEGTITFTRPSTGYTAQLSYTFGSASDTMTLTTTATAASRVVYGWTVPDTLAEQIPSALSGTGSIKLSVYRRGSLFGEKTYSFTAYTGQTLRPAIALTTSVVNDNATLAAWGLCVKGRSKLSYTITAQPQGGAAIAGYAFRFAGQELTTAIGTTEMIKTAGTLTPSANVRDTRGRSASATAAAVQVYDYDLPALRSAFAWRCDAEGVSADNGAYLKVQATASCASLGGRNSVSLRVRYRPVGGQFGGYTTLTAGTAATIAGNLSQQTVYEVEISAVDTIGGEKKVVVTSGTRQVTLHLKDGGQGAAFGKYARQNRLECAWDAAFEGDVSVSGDLAVTGDISCGGLSLNGSSLLDIVYPVGAVYLSAVSTHPATLFGGTWAAIEDAFLLCAGSSYTAGSTGGSALHTLTEAELPAHSHGFSGTTDSVDLSHSHAVGSDKDGGTGSSNYTVHSGGYPGNSLNPETGTASLNHSHDFSGTTDTAGSGTAISLLPPYLTVYAWKRTA